MLMKELLVKYREGHHPQAVQEVRKTRADNCSTEGYFCDQKQVALQRFTWWLFALHFCLEPEIHPYVFNGATFHKENDPE